MFHVGGHLLIAPHKYIDFLRLVRDHLGVAPSQVMSITFPTGRPVCILGSHEDYEAFKVVIRDAPIHLHVATRVWIEKVPGRKKAMYKCMECTSLTSEYRSNVLKHLISVHHVGAELMNAEQPAEPDSEAVTAVFDFFGLSGVPLNQYERYRASLVAILGESNQLLAGLPQTRQTFQSKWQAACDTMTCTVF
jgi:hypothetical protein